jgi:2-C-methyl-D-erythritol 4-phosphate cytidylyltransferase
VSPGAILLCGGRGTRLDAGVEKAFAPLAGRPLFVWSLDALERTPAIEAIVIVGPPKRIEAALAAAEPPRKVTATVEGGAERQDSVARGLAALPARHDLVVIHDSARALVTSDLIARVTADAIIHGAAIAAIPLDDTLKRVSLEFIEDTIPRRGLWRAQTPQAFRRDWLESAHAAATGKATDDAALLEAAGRRVRITPGDPHNLKITTREDLELAEAWLAQRAARVSGSEAR